MKTDGSVIIDTKIVDGGMEKGFEAIKNEMSSVGIAAEELGDKLKLALAGGASGAIQESLAKVKTLQAQLSAITEEYKIAVSEDDDTAAEKLAAKRESIYDRLENARKKLTQTIAKEAQKEAEKEKKAADKALKEKEKAYNEAIKPAKQFGKRLTDMMASALVFNVISKGLQQVTQYFGNALKSNKEFSESWSQLKGAAITAVQPLYEVLVPALTTAVNIATQLLLTLTKTFAAMGGKSVDQVKESAKATYDQAKATKKLGKEAQKAKKAFAGFDEISTLGGNDASAAASAESASGGASFAFQDIDVNSKLTEIAALAPAAIFALGIILTLSGASIPLGIGMIVTGGLLLYSSIRENWGSIESNVFSTADAIAFAGGALLLAIGIILTFCCPTHMGLGIGLIIGGADLLGTAVALNWNAIVEALQDPVGGVVMFIMGAALLVVGILACFAGAWGLGIGCIIGGAALMVAVVAVNWNSIVDALQGPIGKITAIISASLLVLGIILLFTPAAGLGLGLLIAGAAGLATVVAFNWDSIVDSIKNVWDKIKAFWKNNIAVVFTGKFWADLAKTCGNGLISGFEAAVNGIISLFETMINWVVGGLNKISIKIPDWVPGLGGSTFGINIPEAKFGRVSIPRLAKGAVIPPNREFLAVLGDQKSGTNIEAPLDTIKQALSEVLAMEGGQQKETVVTIKFTGDLAQLARVLKPVIETETSRKGQSLATGGAF